jgi:hypothetical protein
MAYEFTMGGRYYRCMGWCTEVFRRRWWVVRGLCNPRVCIAGHWLVFYSVASWGAVSTILQQRRLLLLSARRLLGVPSTARSP